MVVPAFTGLGLTPLSVGPAADSVRLTVKLAEASVVPLPTVTVQLRLPDQVSVLATTVGCTPSEVAVWPVSYTHLDVYKRQIQRQPSVGQSNSSQPAGRSQRIRSR